MKLSYALSYIATCTVLGGVIGRLTNAAHMSLSHGFVCCMIVFVPLTIMYCLGDKE